jgi:putative ABC transport system permease protein
MKTFFVIAWRNILRNRRRSLITIFAIGFGLGAMIFVRGYIDGAHLQMKENFTGLLMGHIQIHSKGFEKTMAINRVIKDPTPIESILQGRPEIVVYSRRVRTFSLFSTTENSVGGMLIGIDPVNESKVSKIRNSVVSGRFITAEDVRGIVLGNVLAENLLVTLGDKVVAMAQATDGTLGAEAFRVKGIIKTGVEEIDKGVAFVHLQDVQRMLVLKEAVTDFVIRVDSFDRLNGVAQVLKAKLPIDDLEIMTWSEISPILQQWMDFDEAFAYVFLLIVLVVIVAGILNTILMSLLERTREFGVMMALGTKGYQLALMVGIESFLLGLMGMIIGMMIGLSSTWIFSYWGIPISSKVKEAMASFFMSDVIYPTIEIEHVISSALVVLISSILISLYPAWKVSKLRPVKALHSV